MPQGRSPRHQRSGRRRSRPQTRPAPAPEVEPTAQPVRLQKLLSAAGFGSRRGSEEYLRSGRVTVNGEVAKLGDSAVPGRDLVAVDGERLAREPIAYWILNKPRGVVTTVRDPEGRASVLGLLPTGLPHLYPVGRLDRESTGLVLLTNDGDLTHALLHPSHGNEREYHVTVRGELDRKAQGALARGVVLEEGRTAAARVSNVVFDEAIGVSSFSLTLVEGRNRQIRRSLLVLGHPVKRLVRTRIGPLRLGKLPRGEARELRPAEVAALHKHAQLLAQNRHARRRGSSARS